MPVKYGLAATYSLSAGCSGTYRLKFDVFVFMRTVFLVRLRILKGSILHAIHKASVSCKIT